ncbi:SpoIIE family protein phosphatase [bacterium]|nr:SpoIIE family protein phosphatase [bacterium]
MNINKIIEWIMIAIVVILIPFSVLMSQKEYNIIPLLLTDTKMLSGAIMNILDSYLVDDYNDPESLRERLNDATPREDSNVISNIHENQVKIDSSSTFIEGFNKGFNDYITIYPSDISISNLIKNMDASEQNHNFNIYLQKRIEQGFSLDQDKARIISIDEVPYELIKKDMALGLYVLSGSDLKNEIIDIYKDRGFSIQNKMEVEYDNQIFSLILEKQDFPLNLFLRFFLKLYLPILVFLFLALKKNTEKHNYFKLIVFLLLVRLIISMISLIYSGNLIFYFLEKSLIPLILMIIICTFFRRNYYSNKTLYIIVITLNLVSFALQILFLMYLAIILFIYIMIQHENSINKRFYRKNLYYFCIYFLVLFISLIPDSFYGTALMLTSNVPNPTYIEKGIINLIYFLASTSLFNYTIYCLIFISFMYRFVRIKVSLIDKIFKNVLILSSILLFYFGLININTLLRDYINNFLVIFFLLFSFWFIMKIIKIFPVLYPIRFSLNKKIIHFLNRSYTFFESEKYSSFFVSYLKSINKKYKVGFLTDKTFYGDNFEQFDFEYAKELINLSQESVKFMNMDIEILNDTSIGRKLPDIEQLNLPHLLYPIYNDNKDIIAVIILGKFPGINWQESLVEAIYKLVEVFSGFYLNFLNHENYLEQEKLIVKEQEEKLYNQKIAELKTQQNEELKAEKKLITESIEYAARIQKSLVPQAQELDSAFDYYFVIWQERDIVGGDLYWALQIPNSDNFLFSVIDCTGHGIPGALMSVTANSSLERITKEHQCYQPNLILNQLHQIIGATLHQAEQNTQQDGMDMSIINYNKHSKKVHFAGAKHDLIIVKGKTQELQVIKGDKYSIGGLKWEKEINFTPHELDLERGDTLYLFTDGILDQPYPNEDDKLRRLGTQRWYELLVENNQQSMPKIKSKIQELITQMIKSSPQRDDICIVGIRID